MKLVNIHKLTATTLFLITGLFNSEAQVWSIQQCIDSAQKNNKTILINRNKVSLEEQRNKEIKGNLIPKLSVNADYKYFTHLPYQLLPLNTFNPSAPVGEFREAQFGVPHNLNANLQLSIPIYNASAYGALENSRTAIEVTELHLFKIEEQVVYDVSNLYFNAQILQNQKNFVEQNIKNSELLLTAIQLLHQQLLATNIDVNKINLQIAQFHNQKANIDSRLQQALNGLKLLTGLPMEYPLAIETEIQLRDTIYNQKTPTLDMLILKKQNSMLLTELGTLNKSRYIPSLHLYATYGYTGFGYDKKPNNFLHFYPIGFTALQVSYPIFNGTVTQRKINQVNINLQNNTLQTNQLVEQTSMQLSNAVIQLNTAKISMNTTKQQIELGQSIYNQTVLLQKQGLATLTEVLLADNALREAQQAYLNAAIEYLKSDLELRKLSNQLTTH